MSARAALVVTLCAACSSTPTAGGCPKFVSTADLTTPAISFADDVVPLFRVYCSVGGDSCHGDPGVAALSRPFLGYPDVDAGVAALSAIRLAIVSVKSTEDLQMSLVTPGDPEQSFLMRKMDGDQCTLIAECMQGPSFRPNCGNFMPYQAPDVLPVATRDVVRRWIAQGAQ